MKKILFVMTLDLILIEIYKTIFLTKNNNMKKKLFYLNPASAHQVFIWWRYFFDTYFDFYVASHDEINDVKNHIYLEYKKIIRIWKNFIAFYDKKKLDIKNNDAVFLWDIFTNTLCYTLKKGNKLIKYMKNLVMIFKLAIYLIKKRK